MRIRLSSRKAVASATSSHLMLRALINCDAGWSGMVDWNLGKLALPYHAHR